MDVYFLLGALIAALLMIGWIILSKNRKRLAQNNRVYVVDKSDESKPQIRICFSNKTTGSELKVYSPYYNKMIKVILEGREYVYRGKKK